MTNWYKRAGGELWQQYSPEPAVAIREMVKLLASIDPLGQGDSGQSGARDIMDITKDLFDAANAIENPDEEQIMQEDYEAEVRSDDAFNARNEFL